MRLTVRQLKGLIREAIEEQSQTYYVLLVGRARSRLAGVFSSKEAAQAALQKHFGRQPGRPGRAGIIQSVQFEPSDEELADLYNEMDEGGFL